MSRNPFGWRRASDRLVDQPCETCGGALPCACPECPVCHEAGNPYCYEEGHLTYTHEQRVGRAKLEVARAREQLQTAEEILEYLRKESD